MGRRTHSQCRLPETKDVVDNDERVLRIVGAGSVHLIEVSDRLELARGSVRAGRRNGIRHLGWRGRGRAALGVLWVVSCLPIPQLRLALAVKLRACTAGNVAFGTVGMAAVHRVNANRAGAVRVTRIQRRSTPPGQPRGQLHSLFCDMFVR